MLVHLDHLVRQAKLDHKVHKVHPEATVPQGKRVNKGTQDTLELQANQGSMVKREPLELMALLVFPERQDYLAKTGILEARDLLDLKAKLVHLALASKSLVLLAYREKTVK